MELDQRVDDGNGAEISKMLWSGLLGQQREQDNVPMTRQIRYITGSDKPSRNESIEDVCGSFTAGL
eukprot:1660659-Amphidinium_carterae.3